MADVAVIKDSLRAGVIILSRFLVFHLPSESVVDQACSPKDPGPFLGTTPVLTIDVQEDAPLMTLGELRVHGVLGGQGADGMVFEVLPNYLFLNPEDYFNFVYKNNTNFAELKLQLDRDGPTAEMDDDLNYFSFTLKCSLAANTSNETYFDVKIFVHDVNDNSPQFGDFSTNITVNELTPVGTTVLHVEATDLDLLNNLTYTLRPRSETSRSDDMSSHFAIDPVTGDITISHPLDYEAMSEGSLTVMVQGEEIRVRPVPNKVDTYVPIKARDLDNSNNTITFSIISTIPPGSEDKFTVNVSPSGSPEYVVTIYPKESMTVNHGFEIFLKAEEVSFQKRFAVAMILFEDPNQASSSEAQSGTNCGNQSGTQDKYTEPVIALIIVVAILAALLFCLGTRLPHRHVPVVEREKR
ncbi:hypothetical protein C0Q70_01752 [Pomacea canaliculata]|uniref:Cadherin domain-containing protein n=1 Tax=Pomacea canaliculata TaxID=400727 RepID=A0A2T7Q0C1_POMCA|nr:hypothetical protein C0Q70_01752 [Pomacea canaliculata]